MTYSKDLVERFDNWVARPRTGSLSEQRRMAEFASELREALDLNIRKLDETEKRLSLFLDEVTGSHLSKPGYDVMTMVEYTRAHFARESADEI